jgi:Uma2 family endonuclease
MTAVAKAAEWITPEDYLEWERSSEIRHEYVDGRVYAMAGASDDHNRITGNIFGELHSALRGKRCEPFATDMKVRVPSLSVTDVFYYPDVLVACDPADNARYHRERPSVIFEVLSPETERTDQREKAIAYWQLPSVEQYILVEQDRPRLTVLQRAESGWRKEIIEGPAGVLKLPGLGVELPLARIYERTALARPGT